MKKQEPTPEEVAKWQEEWVKLVHEGTCCASVEKDPHSEEKQQFLEDIKKESE